MENLWRCSQKRFIIWLYATRLLSCRAWHLAKPFLVALWSVKLEPPMKSIVSPHKDVVFNTFQTFFLYDSFDMLSPAYKIPTNVFHLTMLLILRHKFLLVVNLKLYLFIFFFLGANFVLWVLTLTIWAVHKSGLFRDGRLWRFFKERKVVGLHLNWKGDNYVGCHVYNHGLNFAMPRRESYCNIACQTFITFYPSWLQI